MKLTLTALLAILIICLNSCAFVKPYQKTYTADPENNVVCRIENKISRKTKDIKFIKSKECFTLNHKDKDGKYKFSKYEGYVLISLKAIKEMALKLALEK